MIETLITRIDDSDSDSEIEEVYTFPSVQQHSLKHTLVECLESVKKEVSSIFDVINYDIIKLINTNCISHIYTDLIRYCLIYNVENNLYNNTYL